MVTWKIPDVHVLPGWLTRQRRSKNKERSSTAGRAAWLQEIWPGRSLCRRPASSAVWRTAAGCHPRPSLARCGPGPGWRSPPAARTRRDPPRSGRVAGNDLRFDSITAFCDPRSRKSERQNESPQQLPASPVSSGWWTVTELTGSSQPHRLLKVTLALSTWKSGISALHNKEGKGLCVGQSEQTQQFLESG